MCDEVTSDNVQYGAWELTLLLILESLSLSSLVNTFEQWVIRRSLGEKVERVPELETKKSTCTSCLLYTLKLTGSCLCSGLCGNKDSPDDGVISEVLEWRHA